MEEGDKLLQSKRSRRWRLALGALDQQKGEEDLNQLEKTIDETLSELYESEKEGRLTKSRTLSAKWFANIRTLFPVPIVRVVQKDAIEKFGIKKLLSQPNFLNEVEPDVEMVAAILSVKQALSASALSTARRLVERLAKNLESKLKFRLLDRLAGRRDPAQRTRHPRPMDIDWDLTIRQNLKHYQHDLNTIIPELLIGRPRRHQALKNIILLVDQSASMAASFIHAGVLGSVMASIKSLKTHLVIFDTDVVDLSAYLQDPVELLMRAQLGGGTNIQKALHYATQLLEEGKDTLVVLISDLFEGAPDDLMIGRVQHLLRRGVHVICLLALDDQGTPVYDRQMAAQLASLDVPSFAAAPITFPEVMAAALNGEDLSRFQS